MPDLSWDGAVFVEVEDKGISNTMKRERERDWLIDWFEYASFIRWASAKSEEAYVWRCVILNTMANIVSYSEVGNFDVCMEVDHGWNLPLGWIMASWMLLLLRLSQNLFLMVHDIRVKMLLILQGWRVTLRIRFPLEKQICWKIFLKIVSWWTSLN